MPQMRLSELDYNLPDELIAQEPLAIATRRACSCSIAKRRVEHSRFYKLVRHLREGDLLILNDTRVMPARMFANKESGGRVEFLFVRPMTRVESHGCWQAMVRAHRPLKESTRLLLDDGHVDYRAGICASGPGDRCERKFRAARSISFASTESSLCRITSSRGGSRRRRGLPDRLCVA